MLLVLQEQQGRLEHLEQLAIQDPQVILVRQVIQDQLVQQDLQDRLDPLV